jgi:hypothetical protein
MFGICLYYTAWFTQAFAWHLRIASWTEELEGDGLSSTGQCLLSQYRRDQKQLKNTWNWMRSFSHHGVIYKGKKKIIFNCKFAFGEALKIWIVSRNYKFVGHRHIIMWHIDSLLGNVRNIRASDNRTMVFSVVHSDVVSGQGLGKNAPAATGTNAATEERCFLCGPCLDVIPGQLEQWVQLWIVLARGATAWGQKQKNLHCWELLPSND